MTGGRTYRVDQKSIQVLRILTDFLAVLLGFWYGYLSQIPLLQLRLLSPESADSRPYVYIDLAVVFGVICLGAFWKLDLYRPRASILNLKELEGVVKAVGLAAALFLTGLLLVDFVDYSRFVVIVGIGMSLVLTILERRFIAGMIRGLQLKGRVARRNLLIYGCGNTGVLLMKKLVQAPQRACRVVGFVDDFAALNAVVRCRIDQSKPIVFETRVLGRLGDLRHLVAEHDIDELLITVSLTNAERHQQLIELARETGVRVGVVPRFGELRADQLEVEDLSAIPILRPSVYKRRWIYPAVKRAMDLGVAILLLTLSAPLWPLIAAAIKLESKGPVFFRQTRVGKNGARFQIWKFRTMFTETQPYDRSPVRDVDVRITRTGRILRMGGLDELPQLLNVIRGEMSMVGPRPEMPFIAEQYTAYERQRLAAKPGITGVWQLSCDRHAEIHENLEYDLYYIRHQTFLLDSLLLLETLFFTIDMVGGLARRHDDLSIDEGFKNFDYAVVETFEDRGYLMLALDQRKENVVPESWMACAPILAMTQTKLAVKVLSAPDNIGFFDKLSGEHRYSHRANGASDTTYIPYTNRSELRAATMEAKLVITDLPHVLQWARQAGIDTLVVEGREFRWVRRESNVEPVIRDLAEHVSISSEDHEISHGDREPGFRHVYG